MPLGTDKPIDGIMTAKVDVRAYARQYAAEMLQFLAQTADDQKIEPRYRRKARKILETSLVRIERRLRNENTSPEIRRDLGKNSARNLPIIENNLLGKPTLLEDFLRCLDER